jgi:hypothetical protein
MTLADLFQAVNAAGVRLSADAEYIYAEPRAGISEAILAGLREHKPALLPLLAPPAKAEPEPGEARPSIAELWQAAVDDVAAAWEAVRKEGLTPPQHVPEAEVLEREADLAFEAGNYAWAANGIDAWRREWLEAMADVRR